MSNCAAAVSVVTIAPYLADAARIRPREKAAHEPCPSPSVSVTSKGAASSISGSRDRSAAIAACAAADSAAAAAAAVEEEEEEEEEEEGDVRASAAISRVGTLVLSPAALRSFSSAAAGVTAALAQRRALA